MSRQFRKDNRGFIATVELLLVTVVVLLGLLVGITSMRDAVVSEISDLGGTMQDLNQTYSVVGLNGHSGRSVGMDFLDERDFCDSAEDIAGGADNCIQFGLAPSNERIAPPIAGLVTAFNFDADTSDGSPEGISNNGTLQGDATIVNGMLVLDGNGDFVSINDSQDINIGTHPVRSITLDFTTNDVTTRQVLYEEGAGVRGLVVYLDNGELYVGGWNIPGSESGWAPTFLSTPVTAGVTNSVALVLDGGPTVQPGALTGYLNGSSFGSAPGSQLWSHPGNIGIGGINESTIFHDGGQASGAFFNGTIDNFNIFNSALDAAEVNALLP